MVRSGAKPSRRTLGRQSLHPAWLDAIPASIDDLQGTPAPIESELDTAVRKTVALGARHPVPRFALPRGHWPWWAWATYASTIGTVTFVGLYVVALARLAVPWQQRLWVYRTRRGAAEFVMKSSALLLAGTFAFAMVPPIARLNPPVVEVSSLAMATSGGSETDEVGNQTAPSSAAALGAEALTAATTMQSVTPMAFSPGDEMAVELSFAPTTQVELVAPGVAAAVEPAGTTETQAIRQDATSPVLAQEAKVIATPANRVIVYNTGGRGVAFRNSASWDDRIAPKVAVRDGTTLTVLETGLTGDDGAGGLASWVRVRDGIGRTGYVPAKFVIAP